MSSLKFKPNLKKAVKLHDITESNNSTREVTESDKVNPREDRKADMEEAAVLTAPKAPNSSSSKSVLKIDVAGNKSNETTGASVTTTEDSVTTAEDSVTSVSSVIKSSGSSNAPVPSTSNTVRPYSKFKPKVMASKGTSAPSTDCSAQNAITATKNNSVPAPITATAAYQPPKIAPVEIKANSSASQSPRAKVKAKVTVMFVDDETVGKSTYGLNAPLASSNSKTLSSVPLRSSKSSSSSSANLAAATFTKEEKELQIQERVQQLLDESMLSHPSRAAAAGDRVPAKPIKKRGFDGSQKNSSSYDDEMLIFQLPKGGAASLSSSRKMATEARNWKKKVASSVQESSSFSSSSDDPTVIRNKGRPKALAQGSPGENASFKQEQDAGSTGGEEGVAQAPPPRKRFKPSRTPAAWNHARLPKAFGGGTAYSSYSRYLRLRPDGIGLLVRVIDGRVVVQGFSDHIPLEYITPNSEGTEIKVNDVIMSVNQLDSISSSAERLLGALRYKERIQQESARMLNSHVSQDSVRVTFARPIFTTGMMWEDAATL